MKNTLYKFRHLWIILILWIVAGIYAQPIAYLLVIVSIFLFIVKDRPIELFIGFLFILLLSDHRVEFGADPTVFAKQLKSIYLLAIAFYVLKKRHVFLMRVPIFNAFLPFFIIAFISLIYAINIQIGIQKTVSYAILYAVLPISFLNIFLQKRIEFLKVILVYFFIILTAGLLIHLVKPDITQLLGERYRGLLGNPNGLGLFLVQFILFFTIVKEYQLVVMRKFDLRVIYFLVILSLILSGSRNGMISILLFFILIRFFKVNYFIGIISLTIAVFLYQMFEVNPAEVVRFFSLEEYFRLESLDTGSGRFIAWEFAWNEIQKSFFIGGGFGQDEQIMRPNYEMLSMLGHHGGVHNSYLSLWMDSGIIGVILFFGAFISLIGRASKKTYLAWPFFFTILFNITYESWLVGSLNPFTSIFLCSLTLLVMKDKFVKVNRKEVDEYIIEKNIAQG